MLVQNSIGSCLQVKSSAQTGTQAAATAIPPGGCLVCHLVDGTQISSIVMLRQDRIEEYQTISRRTLQQVTLEPAAKQKFLTIEELCKMERESIKFNSYNQ